MGEFDDLLPKGTQDDPFSDLVPSSPKIALSPYDKYRLTGAEPVSGPFGPANPQEVLVLPDILKVPAAVLDKTGIMQSAEEIGADFLRRTGINPSAQAGVPLAPRREDETYIPTPFEEAFPNVGRGMEESARGFTTPGNLALSPFAGLRPVQKAFEAQMAASVPSEFDDLIKAQSSEERTKALFGVGMGVGAGLGLLHGKEEVPTVIRDVPAGSLPPEALVPAIRKIGGEVVPGEQGQTHPEIIKDENIPAKDIDQRGFSDPQGKVFLDREAAAKGTQSPTDFEEGRLHSTDLAKAQEAPPAAPTREAQPSAAPGGATVEAPVTAGATPQASGNAITGKPPKQGSSTSQSDLQMTLVPGAKEFVEQDLGPAAKQVADTISETASQVKSLLAPPSMGEAAKLAGGIIRENKAELARKDVQARAQFAAAKASMGKLGKPESLDFINKVETGQPQGAPDLDVLQSSLRGEFNKRVRDVRALGTGKMQHVLQDYFPHIWKDPDSAVSWYARILGKRPLKGPASFLKQRTIPTTVEGVNAGLEPVSWNPIELSLLKFHEMDRYVMGQKIFSEFKDKGLAEFSHSDIPPKGYAKINDRIANVVEYRPTVKADGTPGAPERVLRGHWYVQEDAARMLNNFLSPGLERYKWFRAIRWIGNTMNMAQLGLSGYHFNFSMIDSGTSKLSLGLEQIAQGNLKGVVTTLRGLVPVANQLEYYLKGNKVLQEYTKAGSVGGDYAKIVDSLLAGGGRTEMPKIFNNSTLGNFMTAIRSGNYPGAVIRAPFAALEAASHPLMQNIVPRLKLGVFSDMALHEIERMGPNVTRDQVRAAMGKIWDSVDNRMGEMVYDNLFWNRTLKDLSFLAVRAVGWNLGTLRELGGGAVDSATFISRLKKGEPAVTRRMAYVMALPITVGTMGAMYQYAKTGKGPEELKDYFYPKTGKTLPDGTPERVNFPSYLKDIVSYKMHPLKTLTNKLHPLWSEMAQMIDNKDYYGAQIRNPDDPLVKQMEQELAFVGKNFVPFSIRGAERRVGAKESAETKAESFFGIMPISPEIARTKAQNRIMEFSREKSPQGGRTPDEQQRNEFTRDIESQLQSPKDYQKVQQDLVQAMKDGKLTRGQQVYQQGKLRFEQQQMTAGHTKAEAQWLWRFKHLSPQQALVVYDLATPDEKKLFDRDYQLKLRKAQQ